MTGIECIGGPYDGDVLVDAGYKMYVALPPRLQPPTVLPDGGEAYTPDIRHGVYGKGTRWKRYGMRYLPIEEVWVWEGES